MIANKQKKKRDFSRYNVFYILMGLIFITILSKLVYLQIYKHDDYKDKANTTATRFVSETAPRGIIYDQNGNLLATNTQTYALKYTTTDHANETFYKTMDLVLDILTKNEDKDKIQDDLILKLNEDNQWYLKFSSNDLGEQRIQEIRFKRDIGLNEQIEKKLKEDGTIDEEATDYTDPEISLINDELMKITPVEVFEYLIESFSFSDILINSNLSIEDKKSEKEKYEDMSGNDIAQILTSRHSLEELRNYMVVKYAIKIQSFKGYKSVTIAKNIHFSTASIIYQKLNELSGVDVTQEPIRLYPYLTMASAVIGYLSPIDSSKQENYELRGYDASIDLVGVSGIESAFEEQLKGVKGGTTVKVNSKGRVTSKLFELESYPGNNAHLTLDKDIQYAAEQSLIDTMAKIRTPGTYWQMYPNANRGAVLVVEVKTGRILASVSYPNYDPNMFAVSGQLTTEQNEQYFNPDLEKWGNEYIDKNRLSLTLDELFPSDGNGNRSDLRDVYPRAFYNYATQGLIPPGSAFKPMTAIAGLERGLMTPYSTIYCTGIFNTHKEVFSDSSAPKCLSAHGAVNLSVALEKSCNNYFYETGYQLYVNSGQNTEALDSLAKYAWKFGLGADPSGQQKSGTGIEIEENLGQVYNFKTAKSQAKYYSRFYLANYLEGGNYEGRTFYVPFDFSANDDDSEELSKAKVSLKQKVADRIERIGEPEEDATDHTEFSKSILGDIQDIMNYSQKYEQNVQNYEAEKKTTVDKSYQASVVASTIATFVINDKRAELISPAQEIYSAIGQGQNNFSPMQLAQYVSTIANGGTRYALHYVDKITSPDGEIIKEYPPTVLEETNISKSTINAVKEGMRKVNMDEYGTAVSAFENFPIKTAGKTGTADINEDEQSSWGRAPFATYISFAPYDDPEIAVVAVVYDGGHGGYIAPVARAVYEAYFKEKLLSDDPDYAAKSESFRKYVVGGLPDNKSE